MMAVGKQLAADAESGRCESGPTEQEDQQLQEITAAARDIPPVHDGLPKDSKIKAARLFRRSVEDSINYFRKLVSASRRERQEAELQIQNEQLRISLQRSKEEVQNLREAERHDVADPYKELQHLREQLLISSQRSKEAERQLAKYGLVDTAHYQQDQATPNTLQLQADVVTSSMTMCAKKALQFANENSLAISLAVLNNIGVGASNDDLKQYRSQNKKKMQLMVLEAFLCELLFHGFESATFSFTMSGLWQKSSTAAPNYFEEPQAQKRERLRLFWELSVLDASEICVQDSEFASFVEEKRRLVIETLNHTGLLHYANIADELERGEYLASIPRGANNNIAELFQDQLSSSSSLVYPTFLRLAKEVWLLHKVAFACEPASAEIFRVSPSSPFLKEYMDDRSCAEDAGQSKVVALMRAPGFTLRNSIVKSVVCCFDSLSSA